jgi:hypothetical protein
VVAAAHLIAQAERTRWEEVGKRDVQSWTAWLLDRFSAAYASNQFRALQQFFKWLADEDEIPDPMAGLRPPHVPDKRLERAYGGRGFQDRRDAAMIAGLKATGMRLSELAGIRYDPDDPQPVILPGERTGSGLSLILLTCPGKFRIWGDWHGLAVAQGGWTPDGRGHRPGPQRWQALQAGAGRSASYPFRAALAAWFQAGDSSS